MGRRFANSDINVKTPDALTISSLSSIMTAMHLFTIAKIWVLCWMLSAAAWAQPGSLRGSVVDSSGAVLAGTKLTLSFDGRSPEQEAESSDNGDFLFATVPAGAYSLALRANGFAAKTVTGEVLAGQALELSPIVMTLDAVTDRMEVTLTRSEIAQEQMKTATQQRLGGVIPNYYAVYEQDAEALNTKQKLELAARQWLDPASFVINGIAAGIGQAQNTNQGFGQGAQGYAKRYGAAFVGYGTGLVLGKVVATTITKQDPRYFVQGTGSNRSRTWHAIKWSVICRGDNKKEQLCYSSLISRFGIGFLTQYLFPPSARDSSGVLLQNAAIGLGFNAGANLFQEFLAKKITRKRK